MGVMLASAFFAPHSTSSAPTIDDKKVFSHALKPLYAEVRPCEALFVNDYQMSFDEQLEEALQDAHSEGAAAPAQAGLAITRAWVYKALEVLVTECARHGQRIPDLGVSVGYDGRLEVVLRWSGRVGRVTMLFAQDGTSVKVIAVEPPTGTLSETYRIA